MGLFKPTYVQLLCINEVGRVLPRRPIDDPHTIPIMLVEFQLHKRYRLIYQSNDNVLLLMNKTRVKRLEKNHRLYDYCLKTIELLRDYIFDHPMPLHIENYNKHYTDTKHLWLKMLQI